MKRGIVIGKFYPPHKGHKYLIDYATDRVDQLTVIVCHKDDQKIHGDQRAEWLRRIHPRVEVIVVKDIELDDDSHAWAQYTKEFLGYTPDVVFSSEQYGTTYAKCLGCEHVLVDLAREHVPISATQIRANPAQYKDFLMPEVAAYFIKKVCVIGAESTGTTTLSRALAQHYGTVWVPEFGRFYTEAKLFQHGDRWTSGDFDVIADVQNNLEDRFILEANQLLICDTNSFATDIWHERYIGHLSPTIKPLYETRTYDIYLVTGDEIPFVDDELRDGEDIRHAMHDRFIELLEKKGETYVLLRGTPSERLARAIEICNKLIQERI
jgi:HTH-type transcriptional regulator, transcriptional repressor of NAD biosynthesis genes